jgi:hypothetical protein
MGAIADAERATVRSRSPVGGKYDTPVNRESAAELLAQRHAAAPAPGGTSTGAASTPAAGAGIGQTIKDWMFGTNRRQGVVESMAKQTARTIGSQVGRQILRGVLGGIMGSGRR